MAKVISPGEFKIELPINSWVERSIKVNGESGDYLIIRGWAMDSSRDLLGGQFSPEAVIDAVDAINNGKPIPLFNSEAERSMEDGESPVGIDIEHSSHWTDEIGVATSAKVVYDLTPEQQAMGMEAPAMYVECAVDLGMAHGRDLHNALVKRNKKLGMSVYGGVKGYTEKSTSGVVTERFLRLGLRKIAITQRPANKNMWLDTIQRSLEGFIQGETMDNDKVVGTTIEEDVTRAYISQKERDKMPSEDFAGPHQSFPIRNQQDVYDAARLIGHADNPEAVKAAIIRIAKRKGFQIPDSWQTKSDVKRNDDMEEVARADMASMKKEMPKNMPMDADAANEAEEEKVENPEEEALETPQQEQAEDAQEEVTDKNNDKQKVVGRSVEEGTATDTTLSQEALAELPVTPTQETAPEVPVATDTAPEGTTSTDVARSVETKVEDGEFVTFRSQVQEVISTLPDKFVTINGEVERALGEVTTLRKQVEDLTNEVTRLRSLAEPRKGIVVSPAMEQAPLGADLTPEQRHEVVKQIERSLGKAAAAAFLTGRVFPESATSRENVTIPDPLLPGNSEA